MAFADTYDVAVNADQEAADAINAIRVVRCGERKQRDWE
jgi:hypothetical protein